MLTRLKVSGFKNLVDVDVRFGPFTCVAGANGTGKSNLFDAIRFLSALADLPLIEAALSVRDESGKTGDVRSLFHRVGEQYDEEMCFEAEMIVPSEGTDDLGQPAKASITFLRYCVTLAYRGGDPPGMLKLLKEELVGIAKDEAEKNLLFQHSSRWRSSVVRGDLRSLFISTKGELTNPIIELHRDGGNGRSLSRPAIELPRTVLSAINGAENPTALLARREMQSWRLLHLEPSCLRQPDKFSAPTKIASDGKHLAAALYHLARTFKAPHLDGQSKDEVAEAVYAEIANRLAQLIEGVDKVWIDRDEGRELLTLMMKSRDGTSHPARALSDGTMRFLALAVLELDLEAQELLCVEEPENGIHPEGIPKILKLLQDIVTDVDEESALDNPLRQVIINTHSPAVVQQVPDDSLLVAELKDTVHDGQRFKRVCFSCLPGTWREERASENTKINVVSKGQLLAYLNPVPIEERDFDLNAEEVSSKQSQNKTSTNKRRVVDRKDFQLMIPGLLTEAE